MQSRQVINCGHFYNTQKYLQLKHQCNTTNQCYFQSVAAEVRRGYFYDYYDIL